jgi:hypothetical protein
VVAVVLSPPKDACSIAMQVLEVHSGHVPLFELMPMLKAKQKRWKKQSAAMSTATTGSNQVA